MIGYESGDPRRCGHLRHQRPVAPTQHCYLIGRPLLGRPIRRLVDLGGEEADLLDDAVQRHAFLRARLPASARYWRPPARVAQHEGEVRARAVGSLHRTLQPPVAISQVDGDPGIAQLCRDDDQPVLAASPMGTPNTRQRAGSSTATPSARSARTVRSTPGQKPIPERSCLPPSWRIRPS